MKGLGVMYELPLVPPVVAHELVRPAGLPHALAGEELCHDRLEVEHRRAVDGVEFGDE